MTSVAILSVPMELDGISSTAMAGKKRSFGHTAGEALDLLTAQFALEETGTLVIVQSRQPDRFFNATQPQRLGELMLRWRAAPDQEGALSADEQSGLAQLVDKALLASAARAGEMLVELE